MTETKNAAAERGNFAVIAAMCLLCLGPLLQFWGAVFGPLRPFDYPPGDFAPSLAWFGVATAACFAPLLLPRSFYRCHEGRGGARFYEAIGVRLFKRFATNGDLVNRWARRLDPAYRAVRDRASAREWLANTREGERNHLVLMMMGIFTAAWAARIGWYGWAVGITAGNVVFNLYPILLQRYNRCRIERLLAAGQPLA
ncbi:MAG TPA: hypothetical protein VFS20_17630 [Longimicrobium sp.]|nr:hypothetical protein [Longimicrobium sp.]